MATKAVAKNGELLLVLRDDGQAAAYNTIREELSDYQDLQIWLKFGYWEELDEPEPFTEKGGEGSGNFGHAGRPGKRGGSASSRGTPTFSKEANEAASGFAMTVKELQATYGKRFWEHPDYHSGGSTAADAGVDPLLVNHIGGVWKTSTHSLAQSQMQEAAAKEFDLEMPEWQKRQKQAFLDERKRRLDAGEELGDEHKTLTEHAWEHKRNLDDSALSHMREEVAHLKEPKNLYGEHSSEEAAVRAYLRTTYDRTQSELAKAGITEISVYRGVRTDEPLGSAGDHVDITGQAPMVSWTPALKTSQYFAKLKKTKQKVKLPPNGTILKITLPANRVLGTSRTGLGDTAEKEFVVLGGANDVAAIESVH